MYGETESRRLLEASVPSARYVGSGVLGGSATILALMLTMLSLGRRTDAQLDALYYRKVERIALMSTITLSAAALLLLLLTVPILQSEELPNSWYSYVYYGLMLLTASVIGLLIGVVLLLYSAIQTMINVVAPHRSYEGVGDQSESSQTPP